MNPVHCIAAVFLIAGGIVCFTGCDSKVVDVDELARGKSLTGTWILDCDSVADGTMNLHLVDDYLEATARFEDSVYIADGHYLAPPTSYSSRQGWGHLFLGAFETACDGDCREYHFMGDVHPSMEMMRGWIMVRERQTGVVVFSDSVTAVKSK